MLVTSLAETLPDEVIYMVMDKLDVRHLLTLSHVCSRWNALAHVHPQLRQYIRLSAVSTTALDFFQARIAFGTHCPISISLRLPDHLLCARVRSVIFPAIVRNLHRLVDLEIDLHVDAAPYALDSLSQPAPLLENLQLSFWDYSKRPRAVMLPPTLLATQSPRLTGLSLTGIELPTEHIPAFLQVKGLWINLRNRRTAPVELFNNFPALRNLSIMAESCSGILDPEANTLATLPSLGQLSLRLVSRDYAAILASFQNLATLRHILCREPHADVAHHLLGHLGTGALELGFRYLEDRTAHIVLSAPATGRIRTFVERTFLAERQELTPGSYGALLSPSFLARVTVLRLPALVVGLAPPGTTPIVLPHCHLLELDVAPGGVTGDAVVTVQLRLPALRAVEVNIGEFWFSNCLEVDAAQLHAFLVRLLEGADSHLALRFRGVLPVGDYVALSRDFEVVPSRECPLSPRGGLPGTMPTTLFPHSCMRFTP